MTTYELVPAHYHEVMYWCFTHKPRAVLILRGDWGVLCLPRREYIGGNPDIVMYGHGDRKLIDVEPHDVQELRERGWRDYRTHMLPPEEWEEFRDAEGA